MICRSILKRRTNRLGEFRLLLCFVGLVLALVTGSMSGRAEGLERYVIRGTAVDAAGRPVPGALVCVIPRGPRHQEGEIRL